ncbi:MAG: DUF1800 domain-containing protein [Planctomycetes bacterium]|nr:DUF1800 domain-containing protein [Planctomycetota bacterium]
MTGPRDGGVLMEPFVPSDANPFDAAAAAHLLRRAAFGPAAPDELQRIAESGPAEAAKSIVRAPADRALEELDAMFDAIASADSIESLRSWWLLRMLRTKAPFREKLALFFHGHFATAHRKVQSARAMRAQAELFIEHGGGGFVLLTKQIVRDAAMLVFLDGAKSAKGRPNENLARELMELFTLGRGNYHEADIREAARALTGWRVDGPSAHFHAPSFDAGEKQIFGRRGNFNDNDVAELCVAQPACAKFVARKLLVFYVMPEPQAPFVDAFAKTLADEGFVLSRALELLFQSNGFYAAEARKCNIKSPVEFAVGLLRSLGGRVSGAALARAVAEMGQNLFDPPSVKGWDGGRAWIHPATWLARTNFAFEALGRGGPLEREFDAEEFVASDRRNANSADRALELLLQNGVAPDVREPIRRLEAAGLGGARAMLHAVVCLPEYHLN